MAGVLIIIRLVQSHLLSASFVNNVHIEGHHVDTAAVSVDMHNYECQKRRKYIKMLKPCILRG